MPAAIFAIAGSLAGGAVASGLGLATGTLAFAAVKGVVAFGVTSLGNSFLGGGSRGDTTGLHSNLNQGLLINTASNVAPIPVVYGRRLVGGARFYGPDLSGDSNQFLNMMLAWSEGECDGVVDIYLDDRSIASAFWGVPTTQYQGGSVVVYAQTPLGSDSQAALSAAISNLPGVWDSACRVAGVCYTYLNLGYDADKFGGIPVVTADLRGKRVLDTRDSVVRWSDNPAFVIRDYLTNTRYGRGIPAASLDEASFIDAANYCAQSIAISGGSQPRYSCNGVVDTEQTPLRNIELLLTSCRGILIYSGGKYRLRIDKPEPVTFAFTEDNIVGNWQISLGDKRDRANRCRVQYYNKDRRFQPDITILDSPSLRANQDNGLLLEREITLPFTTDVFTAQRIGNMELAQTRQSISVLFRATIEALQVEVGDVVSITHSTPGWAAKRFRVVSVRIRNDDEVEIGAREYDLSVYNSASGLDTSPEYPDTNLPDPFDVGVPGNPSIVEQLYVTSASSGVKSKVIMSWSPPADAFVSEYEIGSKFADESQYRNTRRVGGTSVDLLDMAPGLYDFRVRSINTLGVRSAYATTRAEVFGLLDPPPDLTGLTLASAGGLAVLSWDPITSLDVVIGGRVEFRHSTLTSGALWSESASAGAYVPGGSTVAVFPLQAGTYLARVRDASGVLSVGTASVTTNGGTATKWSTVGSVVEHPSFAGAKSDVVAVSSTLKLAAGSDVDAIADIDAVVNWDAEGGIVSAGVYDFAGGLDVSDASASRNVRLAAHVVAGVEFTQDFIDSRVTAVDSWEDIDGASIGSGVDARVWVRETQDDPSGSPSWGPWQRLTTGEFFARGFEFQCRLSTDDPAFNIAVTELSVMAEEIT